MNKKYIAIASCVVVAIGFVGVLGISSTHVQTTEEVVVNDVETEELEQEEPVQEVIIDKADEFATSEPTNDITNGEVPEEYVEIGLYDEVTDTYTIDTENLPTAEEQSEALEEVVAPESIPEGEVVIDVPATEEDNDSTDNSGDTSTDNGGDTSTDNGGNTNYAGGLYADNPALNPLEGSNTDFIDDFDLKESEAIYGETGTGDKF